MKSLYLSGWSAFLRYHHLPGAKPVRVYIHGLGAASSSDFPYAAVHPASGRRESLLVDLLGFGFSDRPVAFSYSLEEHAQTVIALLEALGVPECELVGHSMGGAVAITVAALRPDLISRLVIAEGNLDPGSGTLSKSIAAQSESQFIEKGYSDLLRLIGDDAKAGSVSSAAYLGTLQAASPYALYHTSIGLVKGTQPTMRENFLAFPRPKAYILGELSLSGPLGPEEAFFKSRSIPVFVVPRAGHGMMDDNPDDFAEIVGRAFEV